MEEHADDREGDGSYECSGESVNLKAGHNLPREHENERIDDEQEEAERENAKRKSNYLEQQPEGGIQESNHQDGEQRVAKAFDFKTGDVVSHDQQRDGIYEPMQYQNHVVNLNFHYQSAWRLLMGEHQEQLSV